MLFAEVLRRFFCNLYAAVNTVVQLSLQDQ